MLSCLAHFGGERLQIFGMVIYSYAGQYVSSPSLGSASVAVKKVAVSRAFVANGLWPTVLTVGSCIYSMLLVRVSRLSEAAASAHISGPALPSLVITTILCMHVGICHIMWTSSKLMDRLASRNLACRSVPNTFSYGSFEAPGICKKRQRCIILCGCEWPTSPALLYFLTTPPGLQSAEVVPSF